MKIVTADITGSLIVNGVNVTDNVVSSSVFSGSIAGRVTNLEQFSASLDATFATDASVTASILVLSQSVQASQAALSSSYTATSGSFVITSGSYAAASASLSIRTTNLEATASINTQASASFAAYSASVSTRLTTDETNITTLTNASASFANQSASLSTRLTTDETNITTLTNASASFAAQSASLSTRLTTDETNFNTTSGSIAGRVTLIEGQYATTGSNTFTKPQQITDVSNAIGFTSTASLYTDGGLRVKGAAYISGTAYFNDVVVYGTSSIEYITSSQLAIGTNIITLNTDTPSIRYGGISVYDSGSNNLSTGSLFWDSEKDKWIYSNPSGSTYDGGMLISGPRNTSGLGNEVGTTSCALMMGQGGDHITSSAIFSYGNATCFYGNSRIENSGAACFASTVCAPSFVGGTISGTTGTFSSNVVATGSLIIAPSSNVELQVQSTGLTIGNISTDTHNVTGSLNITGSLRTIGNVCFANCVTACNLFLQVPSTVAVVDILRLNNPAVASSGTRLKFENGYGDLAALRVTHMDNGSLADDGQIEFQTAQNAVLGTRMTIFNTGIACFSCQVCAPSFVLANGNCITALRNTGGAAIGVLGFTSGTDTLFVKGGNSGGAASIQFQDTAGTMATFYNSSLGIGITTPCKSLHVVSTSEQLRLAYDSTNTVYSDFRNDSAGGLLINTSGPYIINYIGGTERLRILDNCSVIIRGSFGICNGGVINMTIPNGGNGGSIRMACCTGPNEGDMYLTGGGLLGILIAGSGRVGIGTTTPCAVLDVNCNFGSIISATTRTNDACCSEVRAGWVGGSWMRMGYHPSSAVGYVDNTYNIVSGQPFGDIQFRQNSSGTMLTRLLLKADGGLILSCGRTSSIMASNGNIQEWVGTIGAVSNNTGYSLFSITNQYDILSMDIYVFTDVGSFQASKHEAVFGYTASTYSGIGFSSAFCIFKTGTLYNETMTICNLSGAQVNNQRIAIRVWGYGVGQNGTGGSNLLTTSCLTRIK